VQSISGHLWLYLSWFYLNDKMIQKENKSRIEIANKNAAKRHMQLQPLMFRFSHLISVGSGPFLNLTFCSKILGIKFYSL